MTDLVVAIPTLGRVAYQKTWDGLTPTLKRITQLVVSSKEYISHSRRGRRAVESPAQGLGLAATRQWILDHFRQLGVTKVLIMDDDLLLQRKYGGRVLNSSPLEQEEAMNWISETLEELAHCSFGIRTRLVADEFKRADVPLSLEVQRATQALAFNLGKVETVKARFDRTVPSWFFMDDFHITLQLLRAGQKNRVSLVHRFSPSGSNSSGGCSSQRASGRQEEAARLLASLHPHWVKVVQKYTKTAWGGGTRWDVNIQWKKAFKDRIAYDHSVERH